MSDRDPHIPGWLAKDTARASKRVKGWRNMADDLVAAHAAGRETGMREAAGINQNLARKYHGVGQEAWATVLCDGAAAILSAIGEPKT